MREYSNTKINTPDLFANRYNMKVEREGERKERGIERKRGRERERGGEKHCVDCKTVTSFT